MYRSRLISSMACFASFFALCVIALGAFTRLMDAGLGCPDWPGCYGHLMVPGDAASVNLTYPATPLVAYKAWAEMIHRYFVGALSVLIMGIVITIFTTRMARTRGNIMLACGLIVLTVYQILLGQWTVTLKLLPIIVSQHLLGGFFILSLLWMIFLNNKPINTLHPVKYLRPLAVGALFLLLLQICVGAWTSTNYASLSCPDFPFCRNEGTLVWHFKEAFTLFSPVGINYEGGVLPEDVRQTIQMTHRLGAAIVTCYIFVLVGVIFAQMKQALPLMKTVYLLLGLLMIQLCLGISNVLFKLPLITAVSHTVLAALLLLTLLTLVFQLRSSPGRIIS